MAERIEGHYCGQRQSHQAHLWETPQIHGTATLVSRYQCAGYAPCVCDPSDDEPSSLGDFVADVYERLERLSGLPSSEDPR